MKSYNRRINSVLVWLIALTLCFVNVLSTQISYANESNRNFKNNSTPTLSDMYNMYSDNCYKTVLVNKEKNKLEYDVVNTLENGSLVTSHIVATIDEQGNQILNITEGEKHDVLTYQPSGAILLDGEPVIIETFESVASSEQLESEIIPLGGHRIYWKESAPYGQNSDYSKLSGTTKKKLTCSKPIKEATVATIVSIICVGLGLATAPATAIGFIATALISWFGRNDPAGKAWSMKDAKYVHKTKGFNVKSDMSVYKHVFTYYGNADYTGKIGSGTRFQVFAY